MKIFVVYQRERFERNKVGIGYNTKNPLIYIGKARADLWLYIKGVAAPKVQYFTEKFQGCRNRRQNSNRCVWK